MSCLSANDDLRSQGRGRVDHWSHLGGLIKSWRTPDHDATNMRRVRRFLQDRQRRGSSRFVAKRRGINQTGQQQRAANHAACRTEKSAQASNPRFTGSQAESRAIAQGGSARRSTRKAWWIAQRQVRVAHEGGSGWVTKRWQRIAYTPCQSRAFTWCYGERPWNGCRIALGHHLGMFLQGGREFGLRLFVNNQSFCRQVRVLYTKTPNSARRPVLKSGEHGCDQK